MRRCIFLRSTFFIAATIAVFGIQTAPAADGPVKKRVLILGDSISIGYTPFVQKMLANEMVVLRPMRGEKPENCSGTTAGVAHRPLAADRWWQVGRDPLQLGPA